VIAVRVLPPLEKGAPEIVVTVEGIVKVFKPNPLRADPPIVVTELSKVKSPEHVPVFPVRVPVASLT
jgi:hypothetical protein